MKELITTLFGTYAPSSTNSLAGADWEFIAGVVLFSIVLISFFKILGVIFKNA